MFFFPPPPHHFGLPLLPRDPLDDVRQCHVRDQIRHERGQRQPPQRGVIRVPSPLGGGVDLLPPSRPDRFREQARRGRRERELHPSLAVEPPRVGCRMPNRGSGDARYPPQSADHDDRHGGGGGRRTGRQQRHQRRRRCRERRGGGRCHRPRDIGDEGHPREK